MSWTKKNVHPGKIVSTSQEVEVMVLEVDPNKRRVSLGIKQCRENPWDQFLEHHPVGSVIDGEVKNITEFGLFVGLDSEIDGMVHLSDIDWARPGEEALRDYKKGDLVKAKVLDVDPERERISLGIKQLEEDQFEVAIENIKRGDVLTCTVAQVVDAGVEVTVAGGLPGFIRRADLSRDRADQRPDRFAAGDRIDARVTSIDRRDRKLTLSVKAQEVVEEKQAMAEYGSSDSGASLGDILGAAINRANRERAEREASAQVEGDDAPAEEAAAEEAPVEEAAAEEAPVEEAAAEEAPVEEAAAEEAAVEEAPAEEAAAEEAPVPDAEETADEAAAETDKDG